MSHEYGVQPGEDDPDLMEEDRLENLVDKFRNDYCVEDWGRPHAAKKLGQKSSSTSRWAASSTTNSANNPVVLREDLKQKWTKPANPREPRITYENITTRKFSFLGYPFASRDSKTGKLKFRGPTPEAKSVYWEPCGGDFDGELGVKVVL